MSEKIGVRQGVLLVTDSFYSSVNGISVFSIFFIEDFLQRKFDKVWVYETSTAMFHDLNKDTPGSYILTHVYVNANFSQSDFFIRTNGLKTIVEQNGLAAIENIKIIMVSHGWPRIRFNFNYYNIYYALRNIKRAKDLNRLSFYDQILFISRAVDMYRHEDHSYCLAKGIPFEYYDFSERFIMHYNEASEPKKVGLSNEIVVIGNYQKVKNLWWLLRYNAKRKLSGKKMKCFCILIHPANGIAYKLFNFLCSKLSIRLEQDQTKKKILLHQSTYLFIPSFTEYNPIVALEAFACFKPVVSLYKITALSGTLNYHHIKE